MGHDFGRFVWFELKTNNKADAKRFYPEVLGWKTSEMDMGGGNKYTMFMAGEAPFGGLADLPHENVPPHWVSYVSVEDVDGTAKTIERHGGKVLMDAFDIPTVGRMQPVADPEGGAFFLFKSAAGDRPKSEGPGSFHWNELWAEDPEKMVEFYEKTLGYTRESMAMPQGEYFILKNGEESRCGVMKSPVNAPTHWTQYVHVEDVEQTVKRAEGHGGKSLGPTMEVPGIGKFGVIGSRDGAAIGVITPAEG